MELTVQQQSKISKCMQYMHTPWQTTENSQRSYQHEIHWQIKMQFAYEKVHLVLPSWPMSLKTNTQWIYKNILAEKEELGHILILGQVT